MLTFNNNELLKRKEHLVINQPVIIVVQKERGEILNKVKWNKNWDSNLEIG